MLIEAKKMCPELSEAIDTYNILVIECRKDICEFWYKKEERCVHLSIADNLNKLVNKGG